MKKGGGKKKADLKFQFSLWYFTLFFFKKLTLKRNIVVIDILFSLSHTHTHTHSFHSTVKTFLLNMHKRKPLILLFIRKGISPHSFFPPHILHFKTRHKFFVNLFVSLKSFEFLEQNIIFKRWVLNIYKISTLRGHS